MSRVILLMSFELPGPKCDYPLALHQHAPESIARGITVDGVSTSLLRYDQDRCGCESLLQLFECLLALLTPLETCPLSSQLGHWICQFGEVLDKPSIVASQSQEASDIEHRLWSLPFGHCFDLRWIHRDPFS